MAKAQFDPSQLDHYTYNSSIFNAANSYKKALKDLSRYPDHYKKFIQHHDFKFDTKKLCYASSCMPKELLTDAEFINTYSQKILKVFESFDKNKYYHGNKQLVLMLQSSMRIFDSATNDQIINELVKQVPKMYTYVKRVALNVICDHLSGEAQARQLIEYFPVMRQEQIEKVISFIPNAKQDKKIADKLSKSAYFEKLYDGVDLNSDTAKRIEYIKTLMDKPSLLKKIDSPLIITIDDLKALTPTQRLRLLSSMFYVIFTDVIHTTYAVKLINGKELFKEEKKWLYDRLIRIFAYDAWAQKVSLAPIQEDELKNLLFAVAVNKNDAVSKWFDDYKNYLKFKVLIGNDIRQLNRIFG